MILDKKIAKQTYLQNPPLAGIYCIENRHTGKRLLNSAQNPKSALERHRFELKLKQNRNLALQQDWNQYGEAAFIFEVLETLEENTKNPQQALTTLLEKWKIPLENQHEYY